MIPLAGLQDHTCTKTIHSIHQMCLAVAKYTTGRGSKTTHVPRPYTICVRCVWLWHKNTTGRAPRPHMYQDPTQYASDVSSYTTGRAPRPHVYQDPTQYASNVSSYTTGRAPRPHVYQDPTQYASDVSSYSTDGAPRPQQAWKGKGTVVFFLQCFGAKMMFFHYSFCEIVRYLTNDIDSYTCIPFLVSAKGMPEEQLTDANGYGWLLYVAWCI